MAWISVHETVMSTKLRTLSKLLNCSQNEALGILVRLWLWGIHNADETGTIINGSKDDVSDVLTIGLSNQLEPEQVVDALIGAGYLEEQDGVKIHNWEIWQAQWYKALRVRQQNRENVRKYRESLKNKDPKEPKRKVIEYPEDFERFWKEYPRKIGKGETYRCYKARIADGWNPEEFVQAAKNYALVVTKKHVEEMYIKHPKTFLSAATPFTDYLHKQEEQSKREVNDNDPLSDWR